MSQPSLKSPNSPHFPRRRRPALLLAAFALPLAALMCAAAAAPAPAKKPATAGGDAFARDVAPLIAKYCVSCHGKTTPSAGLSLVGYKNTAAVLKARGVWENVSANVGAGHMPPTGMPMPTPDERERITAFIDGAISQADCALQDPGRVTLRRLNREEYNNTIRDLLGVKLRLADDFPSDDVGYGFDNIADVLSLSPLLMEKYLAAAEKAAQAAIVTPEGGNKPVRFDGSRLDGGADAPGGSRELGTEQGEISIEHTFAHPGDYLIKVGAWGQQFGPDSVRMGARFDGKEIARVAVKATQKSPEVYPFRIRVAGGKHRFSVSFLNNLKNVDAPDPKDRGDRNLFVDFVEVLGPLGPKGQAALPASHLRILTPRPAGMTADAWTRRILTNFARRAWRRPVTKDEVERLARYVRLAQREGESFERGIQLAVSAALVSPNFLFRVEIDPKPNDPKTAHRVGDYEMATRLSYFLWSSMPDEELFALAAKGKLGKPEVLAAQVRRMLKDPKARALSENFAVQWLTLRRLATVSPDPQRFPDFNDALRSAMRTETEMFFDAVVREDRSLLEFIDAKFSFWNEALARHYGNTEIKGQEFRRVALTDPRRGGLVTQASVLTVTSNPARTSPVKRGKWVLEQMLGAPPPPPPPGAGELPEEKQGVVAAATVRQRLEEHRKNPACASCHQRMDPIGFGLENFDPVGAWRTKDGAQPIDSSGQLADGKKFRGPAELKTVLMGRKDQFVRSFSQKMLTYALGRGVESYDKCNVDDIALATAKKGYRFSALVTAIVQSEPFRMRRGDGARTARK